MRIGALIILLIVTGSGCTSLALKRQAINQIETSADLRYKEVLDNLALFSDNPNSLPAYTLILSGTTKVLDQGSIGSAANIGRETVGKAGATVTHFQSETLDIPGQRGKPKLDSRSRHVSGEPEGHSIGLLVGSFRERNRCRKRQCSPWSESEED